jgi:hypothetical protein
VNLLLSEIAENNENICQLCDSSKKIQIQRELEHEGQIKAAKKMIKVDNRIQLYYFFTFYILI